MSSLVIVAIPAGIGGGSWSTLIPPELSKQIRHHQLRQQLASFLAALTGDKRASEFRTRSGWPL